MINTNWHYLREWLPWVDNMSTIENFENYIRNSKKENEEGTDFGFIIIYSNRVAGRIGIHKHNIDQQNKAASIGYWLGEEFEKKV